MKIAIDGMLLRPPFSGVETAIWSLCRALAEAGTEEYVAFVPKTFGESPPETRRFHIRRSLLPTQLRPVRIAWEQLALPPTVATGRFDLLHAPGYIAPLGCRVPVVLSVYDVIALRYPRWCTVTNRWHYGLMLPASARKARGIIVPSEATKRDLLAFVGIRDDKVRVIPLGVGAPFGVVRNRDELARVRTRYGLPERYLLFVGQQEPKKNLAGMVEAFAMLKTQEDSALKLVVAGREGWGGGAVRRRVRARGLANEILFLGFVPREDLAPLYSMAELFVFPSLYEGFGLPLLEAMACGLPVVCSQRGALPEVAGDAAVLVDPDHPAEIARAISEVVASPGLKQSLVQRGLRRAQSFTWRKTAEATEKFYRQIAAALRDA
jgi:glycosyltransferase involved in cell wall biosynthesis